MCRFLIGDETQCFQFWKMLTEKGIFANAAVPPAVAPGQALIRTSYTANHTDEQIDRVLDTFADDRQEDRNDLRSSIVATGAPSMKPEEIDIVEVVSKSDLKRFIKFPWQVYADDPNWVPPLITERLAFFDRKKNPFYRYARVQLFLAIYQGRSARSNCHVCQ